MSKDYYKILEINKMATDDEIKSAYRRLAMKYHPDRNNGDKVAEDKFKQIQEAYDFLSNCNNKNSKIKHDNKNKTPANNCDNDCINTQCNTYQNYFDAIRRYYVSTGNFNAYEDNIREHNAIWGSCYYDVLKRYIKY